MQKQSGDQMYNYEFQVRVLQEATIRQILLPLLQATNLDFTLTSQDDNTLAIRVCRQAASSEEAQQQQHQLEQTISTRLASTLLSVEEPMLQKRIGTLLAEQNLTLATMESLTGGLIASALTDAHESSAHFLGGVVAYSPVLKERLGVPHEILERHGVISRETALAMAQAIRNAMGVEVGLGITGVAGPDEQEGQPAGTIFYAIAGPYGTLEENKSNLGGGTDREANKQAATLSALFALEHYLERGT